MKSLTFIAYCALLVHSATMHTCKIPFFKDCSEESDRYQCGLKNIENMVSESTYDTYGLGFSTTIGSDPLFIKSDTTDFGTSKFKIKNMKFLNFRKDLKLIKMELKEDEFKNFLILTYWQSPSILVSGKYEDGKNKGTVSINAKNMTYVAQLMGGIKSDGNMQYSNISSLAVIPGEFKVKNQEKNCKIKKKIFSTRDVQAIFDVAASKYWNRMYVGSFREIFGENTSADEFFGFFPKEPKVTNEC